METGQRLVNIKTISGEVKSTQVPVHISVPDFKIKVSELFNVPLDKQRLICSGKLLKDDQTLADHIKEDGQTVHLMVRADQPSGGVEPPPVSQSGPSAPPQQVPFQLDRLINSMVAGLVPGAQILPGVQGRPGGVNINFGQIFGPAGPAGPMGAPGPMSQASPPVPNPGNFNPNPSEVPPNTTDQSNNLRQPLHSQAHQPGHPHRHVEISLPFDRVHHLGGLVNEMHGSGASFPPPRMPMLPFQRNPMTLLGGFLHNYELQVLRFLPFVSRVSDLLQRESLITDPNERAQLQALVQRVSAGLNEISAATTPVAAMLSQLQIGQAPGQFHLRIGNMNISQEVRPGGAQSAQASNPNLNSNPANSSAPPSNPPQSSGPSAPAVPNVPNSSSSPANLPFGSSNSPMANDAVNAMNPMNLLSSLFSGGNNPLAMMMAGQMGPGGFPPAGPLGQAGPSGSPQSSMQGAPNLLSMMPMFSQILGGPGSEGLTLRELINSLEMHDEEESLPLMDFFYNLRIPEVMSLASGNWEPIERQRDSVRENLVRLMEQDSAEGRERIVMILLNYIQRQYAVPAEFNDRLTPGFDPIEMINSLGRRWLLEMINHVMDYSGSQFASELKKLLFLMIGNYTHEMSRNIQGGMATVQNMMQVQMATAIGRMIPPEFAGLIQGLIGGLIGGYLTSSNGIYVEWLNNRRLQDEAGDANESQTPAGSLLATWRETLERDSRVEISQQAPFSRSYLASDIFAQGSGLTPNLQQVFENVLNSSLAENSTAVSDQRVPSEVVQEFVQNWTRGVRERISHDGDFRNGRFEGLDKLRK